MKMWRALTLLLVGGALSFGQGQKDSLRSGPLFEVIKKLDAQLFDAYNHCQAEKFGALLAEDLEFYHDKTGLSIGRKPSLEALSTNICGKVTRSLVEESLEVQEIPGWGALETGVHRFHHPGHPEEGVGEARFLHLWKNEGGVWKLARVVSYEHHEAGH